MKKTTTKKSVSLQRVNANFIVILNVINNVLVFSNTMQNPQRIQLKKNLNKIIEKKKKHKGNKVLLRLAKTQF